MQQPSGTIGSGVISSRHTGTSTVPLSPNRIESNDQSNIGENGNLFTLTNIYTFGVNGNSDQNPLTTDKYRIKSFVEVFDQPSIQEETEHYRETHSSSSFVKRKIQTNTNNKHHYELTGSHLFLVI